MALLTACGPALLSAAQAGGGPAALLPSAILRVPVEDPPRHVLVAEKATQLLHVYSFPPSGPVVARVMPCTTGKASGDKRTEGDMRTPEGVYWFRKALPGARLPPLYGAGALVMDYPNVFDRLEGKSGGGIWLHGVETNVRVYSARDTRGCVAVRNDHFAELRRSIDLEETPIVIVERMELVERASLAEAARPLEDVIEAWRAAWQSGDLDAYAAFYAAPFEGDGRGRGAWLRHKREVAEQEGTRSIAIDDLLLLRDRTHAWAMFRQEYASPVHSDIGLKTLYLRAERGSWRIVGEDWRALGGSFRHVRAPVGVAAAETPPVVAKAAIPEAKPVAGKATILPPVASLEAAASIVASKAPAPVASAQVVDESVPEHGGAVAPVPPPPSHFRPPAKSPRRAVPAPPLTTAPTTTAPTTTAPTTTAPTTTAPTTTATAKSASRRPAATLQPARTALGYQLLGPQVQVDSSGMLLQVQLLSLSPSMTRSGTLAISRPGPDGVPLALRPERFSLRQGKLVAVPLPTSAGTARVTITVRDDAGHVQLDQDVSVESPGH